MVHVCRKLQTPELQRKPPIRLPMHLQRHSSPLMLMHTCLWCQQRHIEIYTPGAPPCCDVYFSGALYCLLARVVGIVLALSILIATWLLLLALALALTLLLALIFGKRRISLLLVT